MIQTKSAPAAFMLASFVALASCSSSNNHTTAQSPSVQPTAMHTAAPVAVTADNPEVSTAQLKQIQTTLRHEGLYMGRIDGVWGPATQSAVHGYQQSHDLTNTGTLNSQTLDSLKTASLGGMPAVAAATSAPSAATTK